MFHRQNENKIETVITSGISIKNLNTKTLISYTSMINFQKHKPTSFLVNKKSSQFA